MVCDAIKYCVIRDPNHFSHIHHIDLAHVKDLAEQIDLIRKKLDSDKSDQTAVNDIAG